MTTLKKMAALAAIILPLFLTRPAAVLAVTPPDCTKDASQFQDQPGPSGLTAQTQCIKYGSCSPYCHCVNQSDYPDLYQKLVTHKTLGQYCTCLDTASSGYCSCVYADLKPMTDCSEYNPKSTNQTTNPPPNTNYATYQDCTSAGNDVQYCTCRFKGGGTNAECQPKPGLPNAYQDTYNNCRSNFTDGSYNPVVTDNYCLCFAAKSDPSSCWQSTGMAAEQKKHDDAKSSQLPPGQQPPGGEGTTGPTNTNPNETETVTPGDTETGTPAVARIAGLPSLVPACARATSGAPPSLNCLMQVFTNIANLIIGLSGSFAFLMFVYGGFLMVTAAGAEDKIKKGKDVLKNAITGIVIIMLAGYIINYALSKLTLATETKVMGASCTLSGGGSGKYVATGDKMTCVHDCDTIPKEGEFRWSCQNVNSRAEGNSGCITTLCHGQPTNVQCCPEPYKPATTTTPSTPAGSSTSTGSSSTP